MLLYALSTTFLAAALVAATPATVYQRQAATPSIALNNSAYPSSYRVFLTDTSLSESGPQSCDRFKYLIAVNLPLANVWTDTKFRGLIGQARYGPQGKSTLRSRDTQLTLDGPGAILDNIFVDYNYALFDRAYPDSTPLANTTFYFQAEPTLFYAKDPAKALRKQPWSLSKQNTSEGYVVPGQYVVAVSVSFPAVLSVYF